MVSVGLTTFWVEKNACSFDMVIENPGKSDKKKSELND